MLRLLSCVKPRSDQVIFGVANVSYDDGDLRTN